MLIFSNLDSKWDNSFETEWTVLISVKSSICYFKKCQRHERTRRPGLCSHPTVSKLPVQKGVNTMGEVRWCTKWKTVPTGRWCKAESVTNHPGVCKQQFTVKRVQNVNELHDRIVRAAEKLNIFLMCVMPLMVPILRLQST